jgi:hypothetical protein
MGVRVPDIPQACDGVREMERKGAVFKGIKIRNPAQGSVKASERRLLGR